MITDIFFIGLEIYILEMLRVLTLNRLGGGVWRPPQFFFAPAFSFFDKITVKFFLLLINRNLKDIFRKPLKNGCIDMCHNLIFV